MDWKKKFTDPELENGELLIIGNPDRKTRETITQENMNEILEAVRTGFVGRDGVRRQISRLSFTQVRIVDTPDAFRAFIRGLFSIQHFSHLDLTHGSLLSCCLTDRQRDILCEELYTAQHLTFLRVRVGSDNAASSQALATMIRQNRSLTSLHIENLTDDLCDYAVFDAAAYHNESLRELQMPMTWNLFDPKTISTYQIRFPIRNTSLRVSLSHSNWVNLGDIRQVTQEEIDAAHERHLNVQRRMAENTLANQGLFSARRPGSPGSAFSPSRSAAGASSVAVAAEPVSTQTRGAAAAAAASAASAAATPATPATPAVAAGPASAAAAAAAASGASASSDPVAFAHTVMGADSTVMTTAVSDSAEPLRQTQPSTAAASRAAQGQSRKRRREEGDDALDHDDESPTKRSRP